MAKAKKNTLPPHTWEAHRKANHGEVNKSLIIVVITVISLIILSLLLFFSEQFVGKAVEFGSISEDTIGINVISGNMVPGESQTMDVSVNLGDKNSTSLSFEMEYDENVFNVNCAQIFVPLDTLFSDDTTSVNESSCADGQITFEYSSISTEKEITGLQNIARIEFTVKPGVTPTTTELKFDATVYDVDKVGLAIIPLTSSNDFIEIVAGVCAPNCDDKQCGSDNCGGSCGTCTGDQSCTGYTCVNIGDGSDDGLDDILDDILGDGSDDILDDILGNGTDDILDDILGNGTDDELDNLSDDELKEFVSEKTHYSNKKKSCQPALNCGTWSFCNSTLKQFRACVDKNKCGPKYLQERNCTACIESWVCSDWSGCQNTFQGRICHDLHSCGTITLKPTLQKKCAQTIVPGPEPVDIIGSPPAQLAKQELEPEMPVQTQQPSFIQENLTNIIAGSSGLIFLIILIFVIIHFVHHKPKTHDLEQLRDWIQKEKTAGTSDEDIKQILVQHTGWKEDKITEAFKELGEV